VLVVRKVLAVPAAPSTWRRYAHLIMGGAICVPYGTLGGSLGTWPVGVAVAGIVLPLATGLLGPVRDVEVTAARALLDVRRRTGALDPGAAPLGSRRTSRPGAPSASSRCSR